MPINSDGTFTKRGTGQILSDLISALRSQFGNNIDVTPTGTPRKFLEAAVLLPLTETENTMDDLYRQMFPISATGQNLDKHLQFISSDRKKASRSSGLVELSFLQVQTEDPVFDNGSLTFLDAIGNSYDLVADVSQPSKLFDFNPSTPTASENIGSGNTRIAQKIVLDDEEFVQAFGAKVTHGGTAPTFTVELQTHDATNDEPTGTTVDAKLSKTGYEPDDGTFTTGVFDEGAYVDSGTYWLVFERTAGDATFEGGVSGTSDQVAFFDGANWTLSTLVENLDAELIEGGLASVEANFFGAKGNIEASNITNARQNTGVASTTWNTEVNTDVFTNNKAFTGGQNEESDRAYRARILRELSAGPECSPSGLVTAMLNIDGVTNADIIENNTDVGGTEDTVHDGTATGTASDTTLNGSGDKIGQKFIMDNRRFIQHFTSQLASDSDLVTTVRIETHDAVNDEPSGTLVDSNLELTGFDFDGTNNTSGQFDDGIYVDAGTYWIVFDWESGSGTLDGGDGTDIVLNGGFETYTTSPGAPDDWVDESAGSATIEEENTTVRTGSNAVKITAGGTPTATEGISQILSTTEDITYNVSTWTRTTGGTGGTEQARLEIFNNTDSTVEVGTNGTADQGTFENLTAEFTAATGKEYEIRLMHEGTPTASEVVFFDDTTVVEANVKGDTGGGYGLDASIEDMNTDVIGGVPPHGFRMIVDGGSSTTIAEEIYESKSAGIRDDGKDSDTTTNRGGQTITVNFERPTKVPVFVDITITKDPDTFSSSETGVKDIITSYIGGTDSNGNVITGLSLNDKLILNEIISRILDDGRIVGAEDVTDLKVDIVDPPVGTSNLTPGAGEIFEISDADDINVTLVDI